VTVSVATISRYLTARGLLTPEPKKKPKSAFLTFAAEQPNERWQSDSTHYRLALPDGRPGADTEILSWLDDHARYALGVTAHAAVTGPIVLTEFRAAVAGPGDRADDFHNRVAMIASTPAARSPCVTADASTPSASAEPTPEPASSSSPRTSTSASSTPPPENSSASSS
jgi:hypothetical protein